MNLRLVIEAGMGVGLIFLVLLASQQMELRRAEEARAQQNQARIVQTLEVQSGQGTQAVVSHRNTVSAYDEQLDERSQTEAAFVAQSTQVAQANAATATQSAFDYTEVALKVIATHTQAIGDAVATRAQVISDYDEQLSQNAATGTQAALVAIATRSEVESQSTQAAQDAVANATQAALVLADVVATATEGFIHAQDTQIAFSTALVREANVTATVVARELIRFEVTATRAAQEAHSTHVVARGDANATQNALIATQTQQAIAIAGLAAQGTDTAQAFEATPMPTTIVVSSSTPDSDEPFARYTNQSVEIYLPDDYINLNTQQDMEMLRSIAGEMGQDYLPFVEVMQANPDLFVLYSVRRELNDDFTIDNMNIINEDILVDVPLADFLDITYRELPDNVEMVAQDAIEFDGQDVGRTILRSNSPEQTVQQVQYVFQGDDSEYWILTYTTGAQYFEERFPIFEASARTFRVLETP